MNQAIAGISEIVPSAAPVSRNAALGLVPLASVPREAWDSLAAAPADPNGFFDAGFALNSAAFAHNGRGTKALTAYDHGRLTGVLPVATARRALKLPLPVLVSTQPYNSLTTPLLDRADPQRAAGALIDAAAAAGAPLLVLQMVALEGPAHDALQAALAERGLAATADNVYQRAALSTDLDAETYLRSGLGAKKLKELRRQSHRLADEDAVAYVFAKTPEAISPALDRFLDLEARGWKGQRHTGLGQHAGDAAFTRAMALDMGARGLFEIAELTLDGTTIASGLLMKQADRVLFFKIAYDESLARFSPGVQLTIELTRRLIEDPSVKFVDSTATAEHPMIDHVWRERLTVGDLYIPTRRNDAVGPLLGKLIRLRQNAREHAKRLYYFVRNRMEKTS
jgi:CelD/BcsL family acetyltransferase involved in cellulose biosynthesis